MSDVFSTMHFKRQLRKNIARGQKGTVISFSGDYNERSVIQLENGKIIQKTREPYHQIGSTYFFVETDGGAIDVPF